MKISPTKDHSFLAVTTLVMVLPYTSHVRLFAEQSPSIDSTKSLPSTSHTAHFKPLFSKEDPLQNWVVTRWDDAGKPADARTRWIVRDGVLYGSDPRGTWLMSKATYSDFELQFEFKLGERGNSGVALRAPMHGDPAFDGLELQMADLRYNPSAKESELTGGIYRAIAPQRQVYQPTQWNRYEIRLQGSHLHVQLNGEVIQHTDLAEHTQTVQRHDGTNASPLRERPRSGHIGFQELSRGGGQVQIRNARIRRLDSHDDQQ